MTTITEPEATVRRPVTGSPAERFTSRDPAAFELPSGREETWRFTPTRDIREMFSAFTPTGALVGEVSAPEGSPLPSFR